jgi:hypothetical protein
MPLQDAGNFFMFLLVLCTPKPSSVSAQRKELMFSLTYLCSLPEKPSQLINPVAALTERTEACARLSISKMEALQCRGCTLHTETGG